jgi:GT2 family glycosyltransferase
MAETFVSVAVPTHHRPELLRRALESLLAQTYPHRLMEIIVVASQNDAAFGIVEAMRAQTDIALTCVSIPNDPTRGRSASAKRNYGAQQAKGEWLALIDDDCIADPGWIAGASPMFDDPTAGAIEGRKHIPPIDPPTFTYKGLLNFTRPGGYQTCNIFYRRELFLKLGGFDLNFPFYLEDSDMAWTVLDAGYTIPYAEAAVVSHPVLEAQPWRLLDDAKRAALVPYLFKKHPGRFREAGFRALRTMHWAYVLLYAAAFALAFVRPWLSLVPLGMMVLLMILMNIRMFRGCRVTRNELLVTNLLMPIVPVIKLIQLWRGNLRHRVLLWT